MSVTLQDLQVGDSALVVGYEKGQEIYRKQLLAMGLTKGTSVRVVRKAPLGDPIEVRLRGFNLSLRKAEAKVLRVEKQ